jgi:membrane protein DedA with SNARE-associated domain
MHWIDIGSWLDRLGDLDPTTIYLAIGALALLESAAFIGLLVPGESAVLVGGALAAHGDVNVFVLIAAVALGAALGDSFGYEIGRRSGPWLRGSRLGRALGPQRTEAGARYLERRGAKAVFFGRFVAVVRTGVPVLAGAARMPYRTFVLWNVTGAVLWSALHVSVGYAAGRSGGQLQSALSTAGLVAVAVVVAAAALQLHRHRHRHPRDRSATEVDLRDGPVHADAHRYEPAR